MAAAVVELDSLRDAIRAATEDNDFRLVRRFRLVFVFVRRVHVRRVGLELGGAGIDALKDGSDVVAGTLQSHGGRCRLPDLGEGLVAGAVTLYFAQQIFRGGFNRYVGGAAVHRVDFFALLDEPRVDL